MTSYRIYCLDRAGHIVQHASFDAVDDSDAIARLERYDDSHDRELWQDHRKVILIPARSDGTERNPCHIATDAKRAYSSES
jgi:hypothetical protein